MPINYLAVAILICACFSSRAIATTVVFVVTPAGMVVGADGKAVPDGTAVKIFLLKKRLIVADIYAEAAKTGDGATTLYDFPVWIKQVDHSTSSKLSVNEMTEIIKDQMASTFAFAIDAIKRGEMTKEKAITSGVDTYLVQYVVAGYENGIPTVYSLTLMPDWNTKSVNGPFKVLLNPEEGQNTNSRMFWRGQGVGLKQIPTADSNEQKEFGARIPLEFQLLRSGKDLTLNQASKVARALLGIEAKVNPKVVGFPITVVTIPKIGHGSVRTYKTDAPAFSRLPEAP
jgi:hypothetical protein